MSSVSLRSRCVLDLATLRADLTSMEDSILFALLERAKYRLNLPLYSSDSAIAVHQTSFLDYLMLETERIHARVRRFTSPDEHPFSSVDLLPSPLLPVLSYPPVLAPNQININQDIKRFYFDYVLPRICSSGDDENYGSAALADLTVLQLLSRRVHYGKFVAEAKFTAEKSIFQEAANSPQAEAELIKLITKPAVEEQIIRRIIRKAAKYGTKEEEKQEIIKNQENSQKEIDDAPLAAAALADSPPLPDIGCPARAEYRIDPDRIGEIYVKIMELNKQVQIRYIKHKIQIEMEKQLEMEQKAKE